MPQALFMSTRRDQQIFMVKPTPVFQHGVKIKEEGGKVIQFVNGQHKTSDELEIQFIRDRINAPDAPDGVVEVPISAIAPDPSPVLVQLATANAAETRTVLEAELADWSRPAVIEACEAKLAQFATRGPRKPD